MARKGWNRAFRLDSRFNLEQRRRRRRRTFLAFVRYLSVMGCRDARDLFLNDFAYRRPTTAEMFVTIHIRLFSFGLLINCSDFFDIRLTALLRLFGLLINCSDFFPRTKRSKRNSNLDAALKLNGSRKSRLKLVDVISSMKNSTSILYREILLLLCQSNWIYSLHDKF